MSFYDNIAVQWWSKCPQENPSLIKPIRKNLISFKNKFLKILTILIFSRKEHVKHILVNLTLLFQSKWIRQWDGNFHKWKYLSCDFFINYFNKLICDWQVSFGFDNGSVASLHRLNQCHDISNQWQFDSLFNSLCRLTVTKTFKLCITDPLWGDLLGFLSQRASNIESVFLTLHRHV